MIRFHVSESGLAPGRAQHSGEELLKYLARLIGLFAIIAVAPARGEAPANQGPAQKQDKAQAGSQLQTPLNGKQQPTITSPLIAQTVNVGQTATFTVAATGADSYQWRKSGANVAGATSASYTTPATVIKTWRLCG
jgi:hypothetical protein